ncbi:MAG: hypothetical protein EOO23_07615 [Comamonadaceae bacterium]|nr:MAG: hypothetical protein EOO23_07615 [Comamonadaceae bacterium]
MKLTRPLAELVEQRHLPLAYDCATLGKTTESGLYARSNGHFFDGIGALLPPPPACITGHGLVSGMPV